MPLVQPMLFSHPNTVLYISFAFGVKYSGGSLGSSIPPGIEVQHFDGTLAWIAVKYLLGGGFSRSPRTWSSSSARHSPSVFDYLISLIILISREIKKRAVLPAPTLVGYPTKVDFPL